MRSSTLALLASTLLLALSLSCRGGENAPRAGSTPSPPAKGRAAKSSAPSPALDLDLDLEAMLPPVPEYEGTGRNLFAYGPLRRADAAPPEPRR